MCIINATIELVHRVQLTASVSVRLGYYQPSRIAYVWNTVSVWVK